MGKHYRRDPLLAKILTNSRIEELLALAFFMPMLVMMLLFYEETGFHSSDINRIVITGIVLTVFVGVVKLQSFLPAALKERLRGTVNFLRDVLPFTFCIVIYTNMHNMVHLVNPNDIDEWLIKADLYLLGFHPAVELQAYISQPLTDYMNFSYSLFFVYPLALSLLLYARNDYGAFRNTLVSLIITFYLGYVGYVIFPAVGPKYTLAELLNVHLDGSTITDRIDFVLNFEISEKTRRDAFPSLHSAITLQTLLFAGRYHRLFFYLLLPLSLSLFVATLYLRYHYFVDLIAGFALAVTVFYVGPKIEAAWNRRAALY